MKPATAQTVTLNIKVRRSDAQHACCSNQHKLILFVQPLSLHHRVSKIRDNRALNTILFAGKFTGRQVIERSGSLCRFPIRSLETVKGFSLDTIIPSSCRCTSGSVSVSQRCPIEVTTMTAKHNCIFVTRFLPGALAQNQAYCMAASTHIATYMQFSVVQV